MTQSEFDQIVSNRSLTIDIIADDTSDIKVEAELLSIAIDAATSDVVIKTSVITTRKKDGTRLSETIDLKSSSNWIKVVDVNGDYILDSVTDANIMVNESYLWKTIAWEVPLPISFKNAISGAVIKYFKERGYFTNVNLSETTFTYIP